MAKFFDGSDIKFSNFTNIQNFRISLGSFAFILLLLALDYVLNLFIAQNIDADFARIHQFLIGIGVVCLFGIAIISIIMRKTAGNKIMFFPTGKPYFGNVLISLIISGFFGLAFGLATLSVSPVQPFSVGTIDLADIFNVSKLYVNFSILAGFNEEIAMNSIFILAFLVLQLFVNKKNNKAGTLTNLGIAFLIVITAFMALHTYSYTIEQTKLFKAYSDNPTNWVKLNPEKEIPADPATGAGQSQLFRLLLVTGLFRFVNTAVLILTADFLLAIQTHILVNAVLLTLNKGYITYYQFGYFITVILILILFQVMENVFSQNKAASSQSV